MCFHFDNVLLLSDNINNKLLVLVLHIKISIPYATIIIAINTKCDKDFCVYKA